MARNGGVGVGGARPCCCVQGGPVPCHAMSWLHVPCHIFGVMGLFFGPLGKTFLSHGTLFWTPRQNFLGVMGLFFGPLGKKKLESWFPDFQTPPPKKLSDPNLTPLPTHPGIKYVARALAAITISGFSPTGVTCAAGYTGSVSYTVCGSAGTAYSVSGCQATWIVPTTFILSP